MKSLKNNMGKVIDVKTLSKHYDEVKAVDNISFTVKEGEVFSLVGPNGAGKTTTVEILECLRKPTSGQAKVLGYDMMENEEKIKERVGVMPQDFSTFERLTAKENIKLSADIYGKGDVDEIIKRIGIESFKDKKFMDLSGGMKTRVGIGMALISDPQLLFLDEPTSGLDPQARRDTWDLIKNLKKMGKTIFLTTHYMEEVEELADRAGILIDGKIKVIDEIDSLIHNYGGGVKVTVQKEREAEEILNEFADEIIDKNEDEFIGIFDTKKDSRKALISLYQHEYDVEVKEAGMDEVFLRIIGGKIDEKGELV
ncbi:MAG: ABC transporter ATP-binding protein [Thermoplasmata archaeon]